VSIHGTPDVREANSLWLAKQQHPHLKNQPQKRPGLSARKHLRQSQVSPSSALEHGYPAFIFETDGIVSSIEVKPTDGETVKVARGGDGVWALELPFETEANQGLVEAAASQITALQIIREVDADPSIFGFDSPSYLITVEFSDGKTSVLEVGDATPTNSGYYVRVDKEKMVIVGLSSIDALTTLPFSPPYLNTPTPTALPATPTPEPAPEATVTPTP